MSTLPLVGVVEPDAHGQAAMLLAESMLHALIENGTMTIAEAISAVRTAAEAKVEVAHKTGESSKRMLESLALLNAVAGSLASDLPGDQPIIPLRR